MSDIIQILCFILLFCGAMLIVRYIDKGAEEFKILSKLTLFPIISFAIDVAIIFFTDPSKTVTDICLIVFALGSSAHFLLSVIKFNGMRGVAIAIIQTFVILLTALAASLLTGIIATLIPLI